MKNNYYKQIPKIALLLFLIQMGVNAQCPVTAYASPQTVACGETVILTAVAAGCTPLNNNFNGGDLTMGGTQPWQFTSGAAVQNGTGTYTCVGLPSEGAYSLWMGTTIAAPRSVTTNASDLTQCSASSATLCFDMKYGTQGGASPCEGIDLPAEGILIQYNTGLGWVTLKYYDPNGGYDPSLTTWNRYCISLPFEAITSSTQFRWYQAQSSGAGFDAWGLDNMVLNLNTPGYTFDWAHDAQGPLSSPTTSTVNPTDNTTYTVTYSNGTETCSSPVTVTVIKPVVTATVSPSAVCSGAPVQLIAESSIQMLSPTSCGVNSDAICAPYSSISDEQQVGSGITTIGYNNGSPSVLGDFGDACQTAQILFRASELTTAGLVAGKINSLAIDIERIQTSGGSTSSSMVYPNFSVSMGCTNATTMASLHTGISQVFTATNYTVQTGWHPIFFQQSYNWDGVSNIVVQICWFFTNGASAQTAPPNGTGNYYAYPRYNSPSYNCYRYSGSNFSPGSCSTNNFVTYLNRRPNVKFGFCRPSNTPLTYSWTSSPAGFTSSAYNPIANPTENTTYSISVNQAGMSPACATTANVSVSVVKPMVNISPKPAYICSATNSVNLTGSASTNTSAVGTRSYTNTSSGALSDGTCTALSRTINVSDANPNTLGANPIISVSLNMTTVNNSDIRVILKNPVGNVITLINNGTLSGVNLSNTTFTPTASMAVASGVAPYNSESYIPESSLTGFPVGDEVNGTWTLEVYDCNKPAFGSSPSSIDSWSISFSASNSIASYLWTPSNDLSSTNTVNTTSNTTSNRVYTLTVTDYLGCTASDSVTVNIGASQSPTPTPTITVDGPTTFCAGASVTLTSSSATGNIWSTGEITQSIVVSSSGTYSVRSNSNGCTSDSSLVVIVTVNSNPEIAIGTTTDPSTCSGTDGSIEITGSGTGNISWTGTTSGFSNGMTLPAIVSGLVAGTYTFTFDDACTSNTVTTSISDPIISNPTIATSGSTTICFDETVTLTSSSATGNTWSTGETGQSIVVNTAGDYTVTVSNSGCSATSAITTVTVNNGPPPSPTISANGPTTFCEGGSVSLTSSSANGNTWSTSETTQVISVNTSGDYTVSIGTGGCMATSAITTVTVNDLPIVTISGLNDICNTNTAFTLNHGLPIGGVYTLDGNVINQFDPATGTLGTNTITYTFTDNNACSDAVSQSFTVNNCLAIGEIITDGLKIYPNPVSSVLIIEGENIQKIEVRDELGRLIQSVDSKLIKNKNYMNLSHLADGLYNLNVTSNAKKSIYMIQLVK